MPPGPDQEEFRKFYPGIKKDEEFYPEDAAGVGNSTFSIRVRKIITKKVELREKLERRYDWTGLMKLVLNELQEFYNDPAPLDTRLLEYRITYQVSQWLCSKKVCEIDPECAFKAYEGCYSFWKEHMDAAIAVDFCNLLRSSTGTNKLTKILRIPFFSFLSTRVDVEFSIERIQPPMSLLDLAAESIAIPMEDKLRRQSPVLRFKPLMMERQANGTLPFTLLCVIRNKVKDLNWASHKVKNRDQCKHESEDIVESTLPEFLYM